MATQEKVKTHQFYSRGRNDVLIRRPLRRAELIDGRNPVIQERVAYSFVEGVLTIRDGQDRLPDGPLGDDGEPTVQDAYEWLTQGYQHPDGSYGPHPLLNGRVWEEGREPGRPLPTDDDYLAAVNDAVAQLDADAIETLLTEERASHARPVLLSVASRALETVRVMREHQASAPDSS